MNKTNWKKSTGELRKLIKDYENAHEGAKFAREQVTPSRFRIHHRRLNNVQADIEINNGRAMVYYHPRSYYKLTILEAIKSLGVTEITALPLMGNGRSTPATSHYLRGRLLTRPTIEYSPRSIHADQ